MTSNNGLNTKKRRISSHQVETESRDKVRMLINKTGNALYRDISERDYGIDAIVELFEDGSITGKIALLQIKGTVNKIIAMKTCEDFISCKITSSNIEYAFQSNIPVVLIYVSLAEEENFYYYILQSIGSIKLNDFRKKAGCGQKSITVRMPVKNCIIDDGIEKLFEDISSFYDWRDKDEK